MRMVTARTAETLKSKISKISSTLKYKKQNRKSHSQAFGLTHVRSFVCSIRSTARYAVSRKQMDGTAL